MKIGFWVPGSPETASGGYEFDRQLARVLVEQGHRVDFVDLSGGLPSSCPWDLVIQDELAHPQLSEANTGWKAKHRVPVVALVHHLRCCERRNVVQNLLIARQERRYLRTVDAYLYNSDDSRKTVESLVSRASLRPSLTIPPGLSIFPQPATPQRKEGSPVRLLSLGSISRRKGQIAVAKALYGLGNLDWTWTIAGPLRDEPRTTARLLGLIRRFGWENRVEFLGWVDQSVRESLWQGSDLFVLPSEYEGFGMAVMEASARGLPVIAGSRGGIREVVDQGVNGFLVSGNRELKKALRSLIVDQELRLKMGAAGRRGAVAHPSWEITFSRTGTFLQEVRASVQGSSG